jgi:hypothetical protein
VCMHVHTSRNVVSFTAHVSCFVPTLKLEDVERDDRSYVLGKCPNRRWTKL